MAAIKISKFIGEAPKIAPELLPDSAAQIAFNTKLYSGDLLPYRLPRVIDSTGRRGAVTKTIHGLHNPDNPDEIKWLSWTTDVDIVNAADDDKNTPGFRGRIFYTGDGVPKVTTYEMAVGGSAPFPVDYFELGLKMPTSKPTAVPAADIAVTTATYARDASHLATITTATPHGFRTGNVVSVTKFDGDTPKTFNVTNAEVTVVDDYTIKYFSPGDQVNPTADTDGRVMLAGNTFPRAYVFTWMTPWGEESIPSEPSKDIYIKEGQQATVSNLPTAPPAGKNFIRGIRLYRTVVSVTGTDYLRLTTAWYPNDVLKVSRTNNVSRITLRYPHNLIVGDRFKLANCDDSSFDDIDLIVEDVIDRTTITFAQSGADTPEQAETSGKMFYDISATLSDPAVYWGDGGYSVVDVYDVHSLTMPLTSDSYDPPPKELRGLVAMHNNILAGFVGQRLYFSEPGQPHAWPERYSLVFESEIVALGVSAGYLIVLTTTYPYRVAGSDPAVMTYARVDTYYPCLSKRSVVNMGYGLVYATHGGLAMYDPASGGRLVTKELQTWDTWLAELDPAEVVGVYYEDKYFASHSRNALIFERDDKVGGFFVRIRYQFDASWNDPLTNRLYYTKGTNSLIYEWDGIGQPLSPLEWKSKVFNVAEYMNLGAARILGEFQVSQEDIDAVDRANAILLAENQQAWQEHDELGSVNVYLFNEVPLNASPYTQDMMPYPGGLPVVFRLWADGELVLQVVVPDNSIFRLPCGYKADTFEVGVSGSARVKAIHLGETPYGLKVV